MTKIGLVNPNREIKDPSVHLGLGYLAAYLLERIDDIDIQILDTRVATQKEITHFINEKFDMVGFTATTQVFTEAVEIASKIKNLSHGVQVCIGGPHVSTYLTEAMDGFPFDFGIVGEGEESFTELIHEIRTNKNFDSIKGLIFKDIGKGLVVNQARPFITDIETIPWPAYHLFKMKRYAQHRLVTSRGCPFDCVFCNSATLWSRRWRSRSPESIVDEMEFLISNFGRKTFIFNDDSFNIDKNRTIRICELILEKKLNIIWSVPVRIDLITPEMATWMKRAGCYSVSVGIESADNEVLKLMNKQNTIEKIREGIEILKEAGIQLTGQFMIGNPGDTLETIKKSIEFAKASGLHQVEFYTALPYKGSGLWDFVNKKARLLTQVEPCHYHELNPRIIFETDEFPAEDRLKAIELAISNGFYHALSTDKKTQLLDFGKKTAQFIQKIVPGRFSNTVYLKMRKIYQKIS